MNLKVFDFNNPISVVLFEDFYGIMTSSFPKEERRSREGFLSLIRECENYKIYAVLSGERLVAFFSVWEFRNFRFGDHFAVSPKMRNAGIGSDLLKKVLSQSSLPFILEIEFPETDIAERRLNFYLRNGFKKNDFPYILPPMQEGCAPVPMNILSYPENLSESKFKIIKETLYTQVYKIKTSL